MYHSGKPLRKNSNIASQLFVPAKSNLKQGRFQPHKSTAAMTYSSDLDANLLMRRDRERHKEKCPMGLASRDISHIRDNSSRLQLTPLPYLPIDIVHLKRLTSSLDRGVAHSMGLACSSQQSIDRNSDNKDRELEIAERFDLGNPTGRQDIEHLTSWYHHMKQKHSRTENNETKLIQDLCYREIIRQVSVQCVDRGFLLGELLEDMNARSYETIVTVNQELYTIKETGRKEVAEIKEKLARTTAKYKNELRRMETLGNHYKKRKNEYKDFLRELQERCDELVEQYNSDREK